MRSVAIGLLGFLLAGCAGPSIGDQLIGTTWTVTHVDGEAVPADEVYLFFDGNTATLVTHIALPPAGQGGLMPRCRESVSEIVMDTDGRALSFIEFVPLQLSAHEETRCDPALAELHDRIGLALRWNESWEATSETAIELIGRNRVTLQSQGRSD